MKHPQINNWSFKWFVSIRWQSIIGLYERLSLAAYHISSTTRQTSAKVLLAAAGAGFQWWTSALDLGDSAVLFSASILRSTREMHSRLTAPTEWEQWNYWCFLPSFLVERVKKGQQGRRSNTLQVPWQWSWRRGFPQHPWKPDIQNRLLVVTCKVQQSSGTRQGLISARY